MIRCLCVGLTLVFIALQLLGIINWNWIWVLAPIWIYMVGYVAVIIFYLVVTYRSGEHEDDFNDVFGRK